MNQPPIGFQRYVERQFQEQRVRSWESLRRWVLSRDGDTCRYCFRPATEVDHILPKVLGGPDVDSNLVASCKRCNQQAGGRYLGDFHAKRFALWSERQHRWYFGP